MIKRGILLMLCIDVALAQVVLYDSPPATPALEDLQLASSITKDQITWTFSEPERIGQFVNGDYYVVGHATITDIDPYPENDRHGSQLNIPANVQKSGFDERISSNRYDASLREIPPIELAPGNQLVSSRSASANEKCVLRPYDTSVSPVASVSILTSVSEPQPPDAFRPSYAKGINDIYYSHNLDRDLLPKLAPVEHTAPFTEFEGYMRRPWIDSVFFSFAVPAEYQASYGRENGYMMSFAGLLLTLNVTDQEKEPLLVYMVQYGIDLYGLVQAGHSGWNAHGGHGTGRKFPIILAGLLLDNEGMKSPDADFGEDMQTIWVNETLPSGTYTQTWHRNPEVVAYGGHYGIDGESVNTGWGPYEHLPPAQWKSTLGIGYRRCCTSVSWIGEALAARLIPGMMEAWDHPQFFAYVDRWMMVAEDPDDLQQIADDAGYSVDGDFMQGQAWKILSGGGYYEPHKMFIDEMWAAYRDYSPSDYYVDADIADTNPASAVPDCDTYDSIAGSCGSGTGRAYATIADLNELTFSAGDVILFRRGDTWTGQEWVLDDNWLTIGTFGSGELPVIDGGQIADSCIDFSGSNLIVRDLNLTNSKGAVLRMFDSKGYVIVEDCELSYSGTSHGLNWNGPSLVVRDSYIHDNGATGGDHGMYIDNCNGDTEDILIENNRFHQNSDSNIKINSCNVGNIPDIIIRYNEISNHKWNAIDDYASLGIMIHHNVFYSDVHDGAVIRFASNSQNFFARDGHVLNNVIHHTPTTGYYAIDSAYPQNPGFRILNNIFYAEDSGGYMKMFGALESDNNIFYGSINLNKDGNSYTLSQWKGLGLDTGSIEAVPGFIDADSHEYHLSEDSACIDNAEDWGQERDYAGNGINGAAWDIGAYEYMGCVPLTLNQLIQVLNDWILGNVTMTALMENIKQWKAGCP